MKERISKNIYIAKFFAIISVICAHCANVSSAYSPANVFAGKLLNSVGSVGVGVFMFLSGYLLYTTKRNFGSFLKSKVLNIGIPWLFCGSAVYLYTTLRKGGLSLAGWIKWLLGVDTYLYFLSVLFLLYLLCYFFRKNTIACVFLLILSVVSNVLTALGQLGFISGYLNPFNFLFFFACGLLCGRGNVLERVFDIAGKLCFCLAATYLLLLLTFTWFDVAIGYFKIFYIPVEAIAILGILGMTDRIRNCCPGVLTDMGRCSFSVYLLHMPVAGLVANIFDRIDFFSLTLLRPLVVLAITYFAIRLLMWAVNRTPLLKAVKTLIGVK